MLFKTDVTSKRKHPDVARFGVRHRLPVDCDILEYDMLDCPVRIVSADPRRIGAVPGAGNILVVDMFDPFARYRIVLRVEEHADIEQLSELERFNPDVPVGHISDRIVIAGINRHTAPIVGLRLMMLEHIDIFEHDVLNDVPLMVIAVPADIHRMSHVSP